MTMDVLHDMVRPDLVAASMPKTIKPEGRWSIVEVDGYEDFEKNLEHPAGALSLRSLVDGVLAVVSVRVGWARA